MCYGVSMAEGQSNQNQRGIERPGTPPTSGVPWRLVRFDGALGATRRVVRQIQRHAVSTRDEGDRRPVVITPGPRWVLEPHAEPALVSVLEADPGADGVIGWWRWADHAREGERAIAATVRVGGVGEHGGDDVRAIELLARPMSVGVIVIRAAALERVAAIELDRTGDRGVMPADAILDAASTWVMAAALVGHGGRLATLPRTCSERRRTIAEDPERLTPLGRAWLIQIALNWFGPSDVWSELLARWRMAPAAEPSGLPSPGSPGVPRAGDAS